MKIIRNTIPISDLFSQMVEHELIINRAYQRSEGLWPLSARSYFIDTLLNEFPFPKIVIRQTIDLKTKRTKREIIDGQQRLTTIKSFIDDDFKLSNTSTDYKGLKFSDLSDDLQSKFLSYEVSTDTVTSATESEILEIFRRINSYNLPLKEPEKRHASYQGQFKWFIKELLDLYSPMLQEYKIFTLREISRMSDAEMITELCQIILDGIRTRRAEFLDKIYENNDKNFDRRDELYIKVTETLDFIKVEFNQILESEVLKSYSFYSLFSALIYNRYGISNVSTDEVDGLEPTGQYTSNTSQAIQNILELFNVDEEQMNVDEDDNNAGKNDSFSKVLKGAAGATTTDGNRRLRLKWLVKALQNKLN